MSNQLLWTQHQTECSGHLIKPIQSNTSPVLSVSSERQGQKTVWKKIPDRDILISNLYFVTETPLENRDFRMSVIISTLSRLYVFTESVPIRYLTVQSNSHTVQSSTLQLVSNIVQQAQIQWDTCITHGPNVGPCFRGRGIFLETCPNQPVHLKHFCCPHTGQMCGKIKEWTAFYVKCRVTVTDWITELR